MELDVIYKNNYNAVYNYLKKKSWENIDESNIDEIINKSFLEFYKKADKKYPEVSDKRYIQGFAYNIMRNYSTFNKRYYAKNIELQDYHCNISNKKDLSDIVVEKERREIVLKSLDNLDTTEREIIVLRYYDDFNYKEISQMLNIYYTDVKKHEKNSLIKLKDYLQSIEYEL